MKLRQVKKQLKKQCMEEIKVILKDREIKQDKLKLVQLDEDGEYVFHSKKNDLFIGLYPYFGNKRVYTTYLTNDCIW